MNAVDGSDHYSKTPDEPPPSLLTIILDTNPNAWALLAATLPLSKALANLLVFINAHLAFNHANEVAIVASHTQRAEFLYPTPRPPTPSEHAPTDDANQYRPFRQVQETLLSTLSRLLYTTNPSTLPQTPTTSIAGALTLALTHTNKQVLLHTPTPSTTSSVQSSQPIPTNPSESTSSNNQNSLPPTLTARILILSVSGDLAHQYIPIMNTIFACQRLQIPIDICKISGDTVFLQQASDATGGTYINLTHPQGLLQYLMMALLPDQTSRRSLIRPTQVGVDFRAACFCHRRVVDVGFVCSICLSIFCSPPEAAICLTCGTHLSLGNYGGKPAVIQRRKKKRKFRVDGEGGGRASASRVGTPGP